MATTLSIECDTCGETVEVSDYRGIKACISGLEEDGWEITSDSYECGSDTCPECVQKRDKETDAIVDLEDERRSLRDFFYTGMPLDGLTYVGYECRIPDGRDRSVYPDSRMESRALVLYRETK